MEYWKECISEAFDEAKIVATPEQIAEVAECVEGAHDNYGMAYGHDAIPNPLAQENERLAADLKTERDKVNCDECGGSGSITTRGPSHSATSDCMKCKGEGRHAP